MCSAPSIVYIDMAYTYSMINSRGLHQYLRSKEVGGYFEKVWTIHPLADIPEAKTPENKGFILKAHNFSNNHVVLEGSSTYFGLPKWATALNVALSQIIFIFDIARLIKREQIEFFQTEEPYFGGIIGIIIKFLTNAKLIVAVVANYDEIYAATRLPAFPRLFRSRAVEKIIEKWTFRYADMVVAVNENNRDYAVRNGAKRSKSIVLTFGRYTHRDHQTPTHMRIRDLIFKNHESNPHFVYVGRLTAVKHPDDVIRAFAIIRQQCTSARLIMVGDGDQTSMLKALVASLRLENCVLFLGNIDQPRLAQVLAGCTCCLSPLTGAALIECALANLPIVGYDRDWQAGFIRDGIGGYVVPFRDWYAMAERSIWLLKNDQSRVRMGEESRIHGLRLTNLEEIYGAQQTALNKVRQGEQHEC
jgi:glycosyltransferase involved in cell wall biosynthesis